MYGYASLHRHRPQCIEVQCYRYAPPYRALERAKWTGSRLLILAETNPDLNTHGEAMRRVIGERIESWPCIEGLGREMDYARGGVNPGR